ncbi:MAG: insulinase family protein [Sandaracinaceae bacterium]|nr:insulinase family protein [Sandaracinaceae bacterium]
MKTIENRRCCSKNIEEKDERLSKAPSDGPLPRFWDGQAGRLILGNQATLRWLKIPRARYASLIVALKVGSRHEPEELAGISHFLEHMLFRGTVRHPSPSIQSEAIESLGASINAMTGSEATWISAILPKEALSQGLELVAEMLTEPLFEDVDTERNVIREELLELYDERRRLIDPDELAAQSMFGKHPLGRSIGGRLTSIEKIGQKELKAWHKEHYVGANLVVAVTGAIEENLVLQGAKLFEKLPTGHPSTLEPFSQNLVPARPLRMVNASGSQVEVRISYFAPGLKDPSWIPASLLARVLDDGMSARVFRTIVEEKGLAYEAFAEIDANSDVSLWSFGALFRPEQALRGTEALIEIAESTKAMISPRELERAKRRALFDLELACESPEARAEMLIEEEVYGSPALISEIASKIEKTTIEELLEVARSSFQPNLRSIVAVGPLDRLLRKSLRQIARS